MFNAVWKENRAQFNITATSGTETCSANLEARLGDLKSQTDVPQSLLLLRGDKTNLLVTLSDTFGHISWRLDPVTVTTSMVFNDLGLATDPEHIYQPRIKTLKHYSSALVITGTIPLCKKTFLCMMLTVKRSMFYYIIIIRMTLQCSHTLKYSNILKLSATINSSDFLSP